MPAAAANTPGHRWPGCREGQGRAVRWARRRRSRLRAPRGRRPRSTAVAPSTTSSGPGDREPLQDDQRDDDRGADQEWGELQVVEPARRCRRPGRACRGAIEAIPVRFGSWLDDHGDRDAGHVTDQHGLATAGRRGSRGAATHATSATPATASASGCGDLRSPRGSRRRRASRPPSPPAAPTRSPGRPTSVAGAEQRVHDQGRERGPQPGDRLEAGEPGVGHALGHE